MLTVLGIILIVIAVAVPVTSTLMANNGLAAAQNQIAAVLSAARSDAIYNRSTTGVCFYIDLATQRTAMQEVQQMPGVYADSANANPVALSLEAVYTLQNVNNNALGALAPVYYRDPVLLPGGIGVALCNDCQNSLALDRYVRFGAIMFDATGTVTSVPYGVVNQWTPPRFTTTVATQLGTHMGVNAWDTANGSPTKNVYGNVATLMSQSGLAIFDRDAYLGQRTSVHDTNADAFNDQDLQYIAPDPRNPSAPNATPPTQNQKEDEELWIDNNSTQALVSPYNGSLVFSHS